MAHYKNTTGPTLSRRGFLGLALTTTVSTLGGCKFPWENEAPTNRRDLETYFDFYRNAHDSLSLQAGLVVGSTKYQNMESRLWDYTLNAINFVLTGPRDALSLNYLASITEMSFQILESSYEQYTTSKIDSWISDIQNVLPSNDPIYSELGIPKSDINLKGLMKHLFFSLRALAELEGTQNKELLYQKLEDAESISIINQMMLTTGVNYFYPGVLTKSHSNPFLDLLDKYDLGEKITEPLIDLPEYGPLLQDAMTKLKNILETIPGELDKTRAASMMEFSNEANILEKMLRKHKREIKPQEDSEEDPPEEKRTESDVVVYTGTPPTLDLYREARTSQEFEKLLNLEGYTQPDDFAIDAINGESLKEPLVVKKGTAFERKRKIKELVSLKNLLGGLVSEEIEGIYLQAIIKEKNGISPVVHIYSSPLTDKRSYNFEISCLATHGFNPEQLMPYLLLTHVWGGIASSDFDCSGIPSAYLRDTTGNGIIDQAEFQIQN